jgi:endonuclease G
MENEGAEGDLFKWAVSIDSVEVFTGLDFFPGLEDGLEERIEGAFKLIYWK